MKIITLIFSVFFGISLLNAQKKPLEIKGSIRIEKLINNQWTFNYFPNESADKGYELPGFDDSKWPAISLPHSWNTYETTGEIHPFFINKEEGGNPYWRLGWGWYRKHFSINSDYAGRKVFIEFEGIQKYCKVWINGKYLGDNKAGSGSLDFDITGFIKPGADNLLSVAVNNLQSDEMKIPQIDESHPDVYGGICRDVKIVLKNKLYIPMQGSASHEGGVSATTLVVSEKESVVSVKTWVKNDNSQKKSCTLQTSVTDASGKIVQLIKSDAVINPGQLYKFEQVTKPIKNPHLWSDKDPYLYMVCSEVIDGKEVVDFLKSPLVISLAGADETISTSTSNRVINSIEEVIFNNNKKIVNPSQGKTAGEHAKIVLSGSQLKILAERGSVSIITADIADSKGNYLHEATQTLRWTVTGPATLMGPSVYYPDVFKQGQIDGIIYKNTPVSNVIRSSGKPGKIHVSVLSPGLASGSLDIEATGTIPYNSPIVEPVLENEGRKPVARITLNVNRLDEVPREIKFADNEFNLSPSDKKGFVRAIREDILKNNPSVDTATVEFKVLVDLFASHLTNNNGRLNAEDYNFNVEHYNNCRLISGYITSTKLPPFFKEELRKYYANDIIRLGSEKNAGDEMNWLNWIPSGGTVVVIQNEVTNSNIKGVTFTRHTSMADIISVVYPQFVNFSDEAKERALVFISKMNPYVHVTSAPRQARDKENASANVSYTAEKGQPVLIPLLKFISE
ncbi:MAG: hypothetical protein NT144_10915 [Bacteroidia bacterium]|nr:hypothetical protein [Bacteroidia bacterium]